MNNLVWDDAEKQAWLAAQAPNVQALELQAINQELAQMEASARVRWAQTHLPGNQALSSSFGIQAAVMLHMMTQAQPNIPVLLTDTGYLFADTYRFIDELKARLSLNLSVVRASMSPAWQEARFGRLWEQGSDGLNRYNRINKIEPMERALAEHQVQTWYAGLRRSQASTRAKLPVLSMQAGRYKFLPIVDWSNKDVYEYLKLNDLPYHPLWEQGYVSVGDWHSSQPLTLGMSEEDTRFNGLGRECGLHFDI
ncbi:phosphoadenylyl-sulfate reductase [Shewanella sp. NIFS-20-20]|uniref:phosphoadenylyl-sulfate reductase n=1 Tax=Shewanella sp. NIFS-20-20 TaxID=2853806 RepID=UPI00210E76A3|nr:phosphoadenylyl-sulfate reductase [Shewanella sp. NIFS-20-20]